MKLTVVIQSSQGRKLEKIKSRFAKNHADLVWQVIKIFKNAVVCTYNADLDGVTDFEKSRCLDLSQLRAEDTAPVVDGRNVDKARHWSIVGCLAVLLAQLLTQLCSGGVSIPTQLLMVIKILLGSRPNLAETTSGHFG